MVAQMSAFTATARRDGRWWVVQCDQYPGAISQVTRLDQAADVHREAIAFVTGLPEEDIEVVIKPAISPSVREAVERGKRLRLAAAEQEADAAADIRSAATQLRATGLTFRDIAFVLGISYQRVYQLVSDQDHPAAAG